MYGSSTILQTLLPAKSGESVFRGGLSRSSTQSFAAVFEKKIQARQDQGKPVAKAVKTEKYLRKNPAKEKLKELTKKVRDTLKAMKEPDIDSNKLKTLASDLKDALTEINTLIETLRAQKPANGTQGTDHHEILKSIESIGADDTDKQAVETSIVNSEIKVGNNADIHDARHLSNRQTPELNGTPILNHLEKIVDAQEDILSKHPELKDAMKEILSEIATIQETLTVKSKTRFSEKLDDLMSKLNGIVVKLPETNAEKPDTTEVMDPISEPTEQISLISNSGASDSGAQNQQSGSDESEQMAQSQAKQANIAGNSVQNGSQSSVQSKAPAGNQNTPVEKIDGTAPKSTVPVTAQGIANPQAFQDTLDAVRDGVQAKTQFQSRIMEQIVDSVKTNFKTDDGKSEMIMKLKPESLGNVALKVSIDRGIVLAEFQVDSQAVKQALEANLQDLRSALHDKGFNTFDLNVSVRKDNQQQQNSNSGKGLRNRTARIEGSMERIEERLMSLESVQRESTIDYLG